MHDMVISEHSTCNVVNNVKVLTLACNFSFPENQGDALLVEVQDSKKAVHGQARIPISSLNDNPVCAPLPYHLQILLFSSHHSHT